jgi:antitoxin component YwqK of YwqJK toxin-antitoxin module
MEYTISKLDMSNKRKLYDRNGNLKSVYSFNENNANHGFTYMMCPYPNNNKIREIIEYNHGIIHGKRIIIDYIYYDSGQIYVYENWEYGHLISTTVLPLSKDN